MQAWKELFSTDVGLLSVIVIAVMLGMAGFFIRFFISHASQKPGQTPPPR